MFTFKIKKIARNYKIDLIMIKKKQRDIIGVNFPFNKN